MAQLKQAATIADTTRISASLWFRIPSAGNPKTGYSQRLLEFGEVPEGVYNTSSFLQLMKGYFYSPVDGASSTDFMIQLEGRPRPIAGGDFGLGVPTTHFWATNYDVDSITNGVPLFVPDTWNQINFSIDISVPDIEGFTVPWVINTRACFVLNRKNLFTKIFDTSPGSPYPFFTSGTGPNWRYANASLYGGVPVDSRPFDLYDVYIDGTQLAMPSTDENISEWAQLRINFAYYQVWFNQYIDWTDPGNLSKVLTADGRPPLDPLTAAKYFGNPHILFYRDKKKNINFSDNHGICGPFSKRGTILDFSPGPP